MQPDLNKLKELNPYLKNKEDDELNELVCAILECGYIWNDFSEQFEHPKLKKGIKTSGLDIFTAESFLKTYKESWSDENWQKSHALRLLCVKIFFFGIICLVFGVISFLFLNWKISLSIIILSTIAMNISEKVKLNSLKKEGEYIDPKSIQWCKTCLHLKKIKEFENHIYGQEETMNKEEVPCKINSETKNIWVQFFEKPQKERTLYPKDCPFWKKR